MACGNKSRLNDTKGLNNLYLIRLRFTGFYEYNQTVVLDGSGLSKGLP